MTRSKRTSSDGSRSCVGSTAEFPSLCVITGMTELRPKADTVGIFCRAVKRISAAISRHRSEGSDPRTLVNPEHSLPVPCHDACKDLSGLDVIHSSMADRARFFSVAFWLVWSLVKARTKGASPSSPAAMSSKLRRLSIYLDVLKRAESCHMEQPQSQCFHY